MSEGLYARTKGSGATTIVLLHGFGGDHSEWYDIQPDLSRDGLVLAYDLPGHGRSMAQSAAGSSTGTAKAILADLDSRGIGRVHVAGFSMGGAIAALMGLRAPERIASLTLLAPGGLGPEIDAPLLWRFATPANADDLRAAMNAMSRPGYDMETKYIAALSSVRWLPGHRESLEKVWGSIARDGKQGEIPREALATLPMPVTVVWGTADPVLPYHQSENLPANFQRITIPGAGHMLPIEARKAVTAAIRQTMKRATG